MESIIETKAATILEFIHGLRGTLWVTFEEGTSAAWLYDLLQRHVAKLVVCDPRKNALMKAGNKSDRVDARKLADLLRTGMLSPVYHGECGVRTLRELARSYLTLTKDLTRVMNRIKGLYRSWAISCAGQKVYAQRHRAEWLEKLTQPGVRRRAERLYQQLDHLRPLRQEARQELLAESRKHPASTLLRQIPWLGPDSGCPADRPRYRRPIVSAPSANCGPTAVWRWRLGSAENIASRGAICSVPRGSRPCAVSTTITIMI